MSSTPCVFLSRKGGTVVEFALVLPAFVMLLVGGFHVAMLAFTASSIHQAVQAGARCASVNTALCGTREKTVAYTEETFVSLGATPTFTSTTADCGHLVSGRMSYNLDAGLARIAVPLSAQACFP